MSMRRPRIKASANLMVSKRKPKAIADKAMKNKVSENEVTNLENDPGLGRENNEPIMDKKRVTTSNGELKGCNLLESVSEREKDGEIECVTLETHRDNDILQSANTSKQQHGSHSPKKVMEQEKQAEDKLFTSETTSVSDFESCTGNNKTSSSHASDIKKKHLESPINYTLAESKIADSNEETSFKCPPIVGYQRNNSHNAGNGNSNITSSEDVLHSDLEEVNVIQMDLMNSSGSMTCPMSPSSPSKTATRQRIRPTPIFGQRRNSFVGMSPSSHSGDESVDCSALTYRRERHVSSSLSQASSSSLSHPSHHHTPHKYMPSMGRLRTESGCSVFSDSYAVSTKSRKNDDQHHRALSRRDYEHRFSKGVVPDKSELKMFDLIYYNPVTNPMEQKPNVASIKQEDSSGNASKIPDDKSANSENTDATAPVPQLKLNSKGELILDDKSLEIETTAEQEARKVLANSSLLFLDENTGMNGFYRKQKRTKDWPPEETIKFYRCLQTIGTDFSLMGQLFPNRTRRDLKLKFKKEERCNLALINKALLFPKVFNIDDLQQQLEAEERERAESERKWKEIREQQKILKKAKNRQIPCASSAARALVDGDFVYQNENARVRKIEISGRRKNTISQKSKGSPHKLQSHDSDTEPQNKKKRIGTQKKASKLETIGMSIGSDDIKHEAVKLETNSGDQRSCEMTSIDVIDHNLLEQEISDLLLQSNHTPENSGACDSEDCTRDETNNTSVADAAEVDPGKRSLMGSDDDVAVMKDNETVATDYTTVSAVPAEEEQNKPTADKRMEAVSDMDEDDIQQILTQLADGSMVLVSTLDPNNADKVLNEIYMVDENTGELFEKPLDIPDAIVQCILTVMS